MIAEKDKCKECLGKKVTQETKILEVHVDKGMSNGQKIPFRGEGDQMVIVTKIDLLLSFTLFVIGVKVLFVLGK